MSEKLKEYEAALASMQRALDTNDPIMLKKYAKVEHELRRELGSSVDCSFWGKRFKELPESKALREPFYLRNRAKLRQIVRGLKNEDGTVPRTPEQEEEAMIRLTKIWQEVDNDRKE